jgi:predicted Zn-dependent protease
MKKIFILVSVFVLTAISVFALSTPRWEERPIKVYIPADSKSTLMKNAFLQWQERTFSAVWFTFVGNDRKDEANITVHFVDKVTNCGDISAIGCAHSTIKPNGLYFKNDIYIASKSVTQLVGDDGTVATKTAVISNEQVYRVMLHEIGHAIGIHQHSNNPNSIMYKYSINDKNIPQVLTEEDLKFVYNVYR